MSSVAGCRSAHRPMDAWCRQAFSLVSTGKMAEARVLAHVLPFDFPWLWSKEGDFQEHTVCQEISSLRRLLLEGTPLSLEQQSSNLFLEENLEFNPVWKRVDAGSIRSVLTFEGEETGLGAFYSDGIEIRSFGPQALPLSRSGGFGIRPVYRENRQWASSFALPEVWMQADARALDVNGGKLLLEFSFFGLNAASPLALAFYAKAKTARAGKEVVAPRSLQRYERESAPVVFEERLELRASWEGQVHLIPLAGFGGFWGCEYLAAFEIPPYCSKGSITIQCLYRS